MPLVSPGFASSSLPWPESRPGPASSPPTPLLRRITGPEVTHAGWLTVADGQLYGFTMVTDKPDDVSPITFYLDRGSGVPTYLQIVHQVDYALRLGYLRADDQLPRIKDVTRALAENPDTVMKAYRELELRGIAAGRPGVGTFITAEPDVAGLREMAGLQRKLTGWLADAAAAGIDELGMKALFTAALRDFHNAGGATSESAREGDVA
jgi:GntR family transcriptional regulator